MSDNYLQVLKWIQDWVDTGEDRLNDEETREQWEVYAGWLDVAEMPQVVRELLDPLGTRWRYADD